ncbi:hypothetical protein [Novipirellula caenicola]
MPTRRQFWPHCGRPKHVADHAKHAFLPHSRRRVRCVVNLPKEPVMDDKPAPVDVKRMPVERLASLLSNAYRKRVPVEQIQADINAGAPTNSDGTVNVVNYTAWLLQEKHRGD